MEKILCLSRAPLSYKAGIPVYCKSFYSNIENMNVDFLNIDLLSSIKKTNISIHSKTFKEITFPAFFRFGTLALSYKYFKYIFLNFRNYKYIHFQHPDPFSAICLIFSILIYGKNNLIVTWHADVYKKYFIFAPFFFFVDLIIFIFAKKVVFLTEAHVKSSLIGNLNFIMKKAEIIPALLSKNNFLPDKFKIIPHPKEENEFIFISVGRLVGYKGYLYALEALAKISFKYKYYIIGNGPLFDSLKRKIKDLKISDKVFLLGEVTEKQKYSYLNKSNVFLFPSCDSSEAYGLVQLEAMAFSLPIINTFLRNGVNYLMPSDMCITVKPKSSNEIMEAIQTLKINEQLFAKLNKDSFKRYLSFDRNEVETMIRKLFINK